MTYSSFHKDCAAIVTIFTGFSCKGGGGLDGVEFQVQDLIQGRAGSSHFLFYPVGCCPGFFFFSYCKPYLLQSVHLIDFPLLSRSTSNLVFFPFANSITIHLLFVNNIFSTL